MSYFKLAIGQIPVGSALDPKQPDDLLSCGVWAQTVDEARLVTAKSRFGDAFEAFLSIEDNGITGDGCYIEIAFSCRDDYDGKICSFYVPGDSIDILIEALRAVRRLRDAQRADKSNEP